MANVKQCVRHPTTETNLACGRCGEMVCPRCLVHASVGLRCPDCALARPVPTYNVSTFYLARAMTAGVLINVAVGLVVYFLPAIFQGPFIYIPFIVGLGYLTAEGISLGTNRKRGLRLKIVAWSSILVSVTLITYFTGATFTTLNLLATGLAFYIPVTRF